MLKVYKMRWTRWAKRFSRYADLEPFEVYISALCVLAGLPLIFGGPTPGTMRDYLPNTLVTLWGIELVTGGVLTLAGLAMAGTIRGYRWERAGLTFLATAGGVYAVVLMVTAWPQAVITIALLIGLSLACLWRTSSMKRTATVRIRGK